MCAYFFFFFSNQQTVALCGTALFLFLISYASSYSSCLLCMALAVSCCGFHNSGILVNPQDIAPKHAGAVFGECCPLVCNILVALCGLLYVSSIFRAHVVNLHPLRRLKSSNLAAGKELGWKNYVAHTRCSC